MLLYSSASVRGSDPNTAALQMLDVFVPMSAVLIQICVSFIYEEKSILIFINEELKFITSLF